MFTLMRTCINSCQLSSSVEKTDCLDRKNQNNLNNVRVHPDIKSSDEQYIHYVVIIFSSSERWGIAMTLSSSASAASSASASESSSTHGKIVKAKDHVQFDINFYSETFHICFADSLCCPDWCSSTGEHSYISFFVIFFMFWWYFNLEKNDSGKIVKAKDHVKLDIKFYFEFLHNNYVDSLWCPDW